MPHLSTTETRQLRELTLAALRPDSALTISVRREFWTLAEKALRAPNTDVQQLRDRLIGQSITYSLAVYEDALAALAAKAPIKSPARIECEARLTALHLLPPAGLRWGEEFVQHAAQGDSLPMGGRRIPASRELLEGAVASLRHAAARLDTLLTRP